MNLRHLFRAVYAALYAGLSGVSTALVGGNGFSTITDGQWVSIGLFTLGGVGSVYGIVQVQNNSPKGG